MTKRQILAIERLIVALDVADGKAAAALAAELGDAAAFYKVGLELLSAGAGAKLTADLKKEGKKVFADWKLFDVPATVGRATARIADSGADFLTVHGNDAIMAAAAENKGKELKVLAITALTSMDEADMRSLGFDCDIRALVLSRTKRALALGCDGVVCSGREVAMLRAELGDDAILVTPGIRPSSLQNKTDDQKRIATPTAVIRDGGDYLVVGRPIRDAASPKRVAEAIVHEIAQALK